jgi:hypothetical protein
MQTCALEPSRIKLTTWVSAAAVAAAAAVLHHGPLMSQIETLKSRF